MHLYIKHMQYRVIRTDMRCRIITMSDLFKISLTAALTLLGGVILFAFGEFVKVLIITPLQKFKEQVQLTLDRIDFYANQITNFFPAKPSKHEQEHMQKISADFRSAATQLRSKYAVIGLKEFLVNLGTIPSINEIDEVYGSLMLLSNNLPIEGRDSNKEVDPIMTNHNAMKKVQKILGR